MCGQAIESLALLRLDGEDLGDIPRTIVNDYQSNINYMQSIVNY